MKKTLITLLALSGLAMGETYTWTNATDDGKWSTAGNWTVGSTGQAATSLPAHANKSADQYIIGNKQTISIEKTSIGNLGASLTIGNNVTLSGDTGYNFIFKSLSIGKNFQYEPSGDGIKWAVDTDDNGTKGVSSVANSLTLNSEYDGAYIISTIGAGSSLDFGTHGMITTVGGNIAMGKKLELTAAVTLNQGHTVSTLVKRVLIDADNIWYRDVTTENGALNIGSLTLTSIDGDLMKKYDFASDLNAAWKIDGVATETVEGAYRYYATKDGIGVQYYTAAVPEPTTATLSLLALAGLAVRRRRK